MKRIILLFLLLTSLTAFAHEDIYKAVEKTNVHIQIKVGYETSWELRIIESYAEIINDFIKEIDSTEKVFIYFSEDYCFFEKDFFFISYGNFKEFVHSDFPWGYNYDMEFINSQKGVSVIISEKYFKLKTLLQLLEFGLRNKDYVKDKQQIYKEDKGIPAFSKYNPFHYLTKKESGQESETASIIDSILQSETSTLIKKYLSKKISFQDIPKILIQKNIELFLQNDSIFFVDTEDSEILKIFTINSISYESKTGCLFILNTNRSFYFINQNLKSNQKQYDLPFELGCLDALWIKFVNKKYKLEKDGLYRFGKNKSMDWVYFDEVKGISK